MSEDDAVGNILLQAQLAIAEVDKKQTAVLLSIEKKAGVFHGLYGALVKDSKTMATMNHQTSVGLNLMTLTIRSPQWISNKCKIVNKLSA